MNFRQLNYILLSVLVALGMIACNRDTKQDFDILSPDSQIKYFAVTSRPLTKNDSIKYPALPTTFFTILSSEKEGYDIFNVDSLPVGIEIKTMKAAIDFTQEPNAVNLLYLDSERQDSVVKWKSEDSIKFIYDKQTTSYLPKITVVAPNATTKRTYKVDFRIHKINQDSITWGKPNSTSGTQFILPEKGESKVVANDASSSFYALIKVGNSIKYYTSQISSPAWSLQSTTTLPANVMIGSLLYNNNTLTVHSASGDVYQLNTESATDFQKVDCPYNVKSLLGMLPVSTTRISDNYVIIYANENNELQLGVTKDFATLLDINVSGWPNTTIIGTIPVTNFSRLYQEINDINFLTLAGGTNIDNKQNQTSWYITGVGSETEILAYPGTSSNSLPFTTDPTMFWYDDKVQAFSSDSISLYSTATGQGHWVRQIEANRCPEAMKGMNGASVIVDSENYIWVFGGSNNASPKVYNQNIWKGRLNSLSPGYIPIKE